MKTIEQIFSEIRDTSQHNDDNLGFVVTGSRGKWFENQWSDYDFAIFVIDAALQSISYLIKPDLHHYLVLQMVQMTMSYGVSPSSPIALASCKCDTTKLVSPCS